LFLKQAERKKREENKERDKLKVQIQRTDWKNWVGHFPAIKQVWQINRKYDSLRDDDGRDAFEAALLALPLLIFIMQWNRLGI
jgi:hypothetical protein